MLLGTLARQLGWHPSTLTPRLIALEERNLIIRAALGPDGRTRTVQLTPLGRAIRSRTRAQAATETGLSALEPRELERIARLARIAT